MKMKTVYIAICVAALAVVVFSCDHFAERFAKWKNMLYQKFHKLTISGHSASDHHTSSATENPDEPKPTQEVQLEMSKPGPKTHISELLDLEAEKNPKINNQKPKMHLDISKPGPEIHSEISGKERHPKVSGHGEYAESLDLETTEHARHPKHGSRPESSDPEHGAEMLEQAKHPDHGNHNESPDPERNPEMSDHASHPKVPEHGDHLEMSEQERHPEVSEQETHLESLDPEDDLEMSEEASRPEEEHSKLSETEQNSLETSEQEQERDSETAEQEPETETEQEIPPITHFHGEIINIDGRDLPVIIYDYDHDQRPNFINFEGDIRPIHYRNGLGYVKIGFREVLLIPISKMRENNEKGNTYSEPEVPLVGYHLEITRKGDPTIIYNDMRYTGKFKFFNYGGKNYPVHYDGDSGYIEVGDMVVPLVPQSTYKMRGKEEGEEIDPADIALPIPEIVLPINNGDPVEARKPFEITFETADEKEQIKKYLIDIFSRDHDTEIERGKCDAPCSSFTFENGLKKPGHYTLTIWAVGKSKLTPAVAGTVEFEVEKGIEIEN